MKKKNVTEVSRKLLALAFVLMVIGLASCGSANDTSTSSTSMPTKVSTDAI